MGDRLLAKTGYTAKKTYNFPRQLPALVAETDLLAAGRSAGLPGFADVRPFRPPDKSRAGPVLADDADCAVFASNSDVLVGVSIWRHVCSVLRFYFGQNL